MEALEEAKKSGKIQGTHFWSFHITINQNAYFYRIQYLQWQFQDGGEKTGV